MTNFIVLWLAGGLMYTLFSPCAPRIIKQYPWSVPLCIILGPVGFPVLHCLRSRRIRRTEEWWMKYSLYIEALNKGETSIFSSEELNNELNEIMESF